MKNINLILASLAVLKADENTDDETDESRLEVIEQGIKLLKEEQEASDNKLKEI